MRTPPRSECEVLSHGRVRWQGHRVEVPAAVANALGTVRRPEVVITIGGHTWRSRVASMGGRFIVGISAANRAASGIAKGDVVEVGLRLDAEPRVVAAGWSMVSRPLTSTGAWRPPAVWLDAVSGLSGAPAADVALI